MDHAKLFEMIFDFYPPPISIEQGLTNRLVPKVSKNLTENIRSRAEIIRFHFPEKKRYFPLVEI